MKSPRLWVASATAAIVGTVVATYVVVQMGSCDDDRPRVDDEVGELAREVGETQAGKQGTEARRKFAQASEAQLAVFATEIERRAVGDGVAPERIEGLRRDYLLLREQRRAVLDAPDAAFPDAALQFETQANTIREQLDRADGASLP